MSNKNGYWKLAIQLNRRIGDKVYSSLRMYVPTNQDTKPLLEKLQAEGGERAELQFRAKFHGSRIILDQVQPEAESAITRPTIGQRADQIITIVAQLGGTTSWPAVREKLGLPTESTPSPFLVKALKERGLQSTKDPKTSTMIWKLIDREKINGWTCLKTQNAH